MEHKTRKALANSLRGCAEPGLSQAEVNGSSLSRSSILAFSDIAAAGAATAARLRICLSSYPRCRKKSTSAMGVPSSICLGSGAPALPYSFRTAGAEHGRSAPLSDSASTSASRPAQISAGTHQSQERPTPHPRPGPHPKKSRCLWPQGKRPLSSCSCAAGGRGPDP